ncbi:MAG: SDR family NAD(P)-dependent oxidoreductase [Ktedonobacteraceae bacterium]|nr:SDR family NAD(P)-dependent oxidoreductase [Ktedonobacteraceae bacterium]
MNHTISPISREPIAIIGIGCRFPGNVSTPQAFWNLLITGTDAIGDIPADRWDIERYYHPNAAQPGKMYTLRGGFLEAFDRFDAPFFGISPVEAEQMDPQQRLLLEVSWEALEDAGLVPQQLAGTQMGVFIGICSIDAKRWQDVAALNVYSNTGMTSSIAANRISYCFDLRGPSLSVDTACSSSLVGVHLACESIWKGECQLALVGGVNVILDPNLTIGFCKAQMLSRHGQCRAFDADADGFVRSEGAGVVVLKPLSQALQDGDSVYALLLASGINQDGKTPGITQPNCVAQETLLRQIYRQAGISPHQVQYIETHGPGTPVGDTVEAQALGNVLGKDREEGKWLRIGSVKTNIGHLEGASGMASLIKTALVLKHHQIPPNLHFQTPNPNIPFEELHLKVPQATEVLPTHGSPPIVGVNNFGFGGTNAHVVLQAFQPPTAQTQQNVAVLPYLLPLSARSPEALRILARSYREMACSDAPPPLRDLCYTASVRREHHPYRLALMIQSYEDLIEKLKAFLAGESRPGITSHHQSGSAPHIAFVFSGNGSQWWAMGRQLIEQEPCFREAVVRCDRSLQPYTGWSLLHELLADVNHSRMQQSEIAQPALFALQVALASLWQSWGIEPQAIIGHSVGEITAAYVAGVLNFEDAIQVVFHRSRLQGLTTRQGAVLAVGLPPKEALEIIAPFEGRVSLASINSPRSVALSGVEAVLEQIMIDLEEREIFCRRVVMDFAAHSHFMDPIQEKLLSSLQDVHPQTSRLPFVSTVTGQHLTGLECNAHYWWENIRRPVQFAAGIQRLVADGTTVFLEIGPHPVLSAYIAEGLAEADKQATVLPSLRRKEDERTVLLNSLGVLFAQGCPVVWQKIAEGGKHVTLPRYPWQHDVRYWEGPKDERFWNAPRGMPSHSRSTHPLLGSRQLAADTIWENILDMNRLPYLAEHRVHDTVIVPGVGYVEMVLAAAFELFEEESCEIEHLEIHKPLFLNQDRTYLLQTIVAAEDHAIRIYSQQQDEAMGWRLHANGYLAPFSHPLVVSQIDVENIRKRCRRAISCSDFYQELALHGLDYGPQFQCVESISIGENEAVGVVRWPEKSEGYHFHPIPLDCCIQIFLAAIWDRSKEQPGQTYLPVGIERVRFYHSPSPQTLLYSYAYVIRQGSDYYKLNYVILNEQGRVMMELNGFRVQVARFTQGTQSKQDDSCLYESRWFLQPGFSQSRTAGHLPSPTQLVSTLQPVIKQVQREVSAISYARRGQPLLKHLSSAYIMAALRQLGCKLELGESFQVATLRQRLGIEADYDHLLFLWCLLLKEEGILESASKEIPKPVDDVWVVCGTHTTDPEVIVHKVQRECPDYHAELILLMNFGGNLPAILTGKIDPLSLIFSDETYGTTEQLYETALPSRSANKLLQEALKEIIDHLPPTSTLRILEIGAGTGGSTSYLLPLLPPDRTEYVFTDISETLLRRARHKFRDYSFVRYQILDIEHAPWEQGFEEHTFDLIIAANVLHATRNLHETLDHTHRLLASQGLLCLVEVTDPLTPTMLLGFSLLKSYWSLLDKNLRPVQPLLCAQQWVCLLTEMGFSETAILTEKQDAGEPSLAIVLARRTQMVQQDKAVQATPSARAGTWLVFADDTGVAGQLHQHPTLAARQIILVSKGERYQHLTTDQFVLRPHHRDDMRQLFETLRAEEVTYEQIVYLWGLDRAKEHMSVTDLNKALEVGCLSALLLVQELLTAQSHPWPQLWIVTSGAQTPFETEQQVSIQQAPLYGLGRVIGNECPQLRCRLIDLGVPHEVNGLLTYDPAEISSLCEEVSQPQGTEPEVLLRGQTKLVNRIVGSPATRFGQYTAPMVGHQSSLRLEMTAPGVLENLFWREIARREPQPGEIEIAVAVTGLNFKDVMLALGLISGEALDRGYSQGFMLGAECAGRVVALGEGVIDFQLGDEVLARGCHCFSPFVTTDARFVIHKPAHISHEEGATLLLAFLTAHYSLHIQGRVHKGERVLIHGAAGGVGLAAIQVVQWAGGEVFATAGSEQKRAYLRSLGVQHVLDSRSLAFADEIMQLTNGEGVDIVLNSLAGEAAEKSLSLLRPFGRFLEIGKRDALDNRSLRLRPFEHCLSYTVIDIDQVCGKYPGLVKQVLQELTQLFEKGIYRPLPYRLFLAPQVVDAFRYMQQARHIGKVVVTMQPGVASVSQHVEQQAYTFRPDASYLITGGVSGFGLAVAQWIVERGGRYLVLVNRSGAVPQESSQAIAAMRDAGAQVLVVGADVTQEQEVARLFERVCATMPPLRGVFHGAMILQDAPLSQLDEQSMKRVVEPKMLGAWNLHVQTRELSLDMFVLFSSFSSLIGMVGQGNYVAGNAFLEALACYRRARGLPVLTIEWGPLARFGYVARHAEAQDSLARRRVKGLSPEQALRILGRLLQERRSLVTAVDIDWKKSAMTMSPSFQTRLGLILRQEEEDEKQERASQQDFHTSLLQATPQDRLTLVQEHILQVLSTILASPVSSIDPQADADFDLDSLMALELHNSIQQDFGVDLPTMKILRARSVASLSASIVELLMEKVSK